MQLTMIGKPEDSLTVELDELSKPKLDPNLLDPNLFLEMSNLGKITGSNFLIIQYLRI